MLVVCDEPTSITDAYALMKVLSKEQDVFKFKVVANMVRNLREGQLLFNKLTKVTDRFLDVALELAAIIPFDDNIRLAVRKQKPLVLMQPRSPASLAIKALAQRALDWPVPAQAGGHLEFFLEQLIGSADNGKKQDVANE